MMTMSGRMTNDNELY